MIGEEREKSLPTMAGPARYRIEVRGRIQPNDARRLRGMSIDNVERGSGTPVSRLTGDLPDQAALIGVLAVLHEYQLPLISVSCSAAGSMKKEKS
jgi:hypothetical protein